MTMTSRSSSGISASAACKAARSSLSATSISGERSGVERTEVTFRTLDDPLRRWYLATGEWRGRAGAYAIQGYGAALVERIEGDFWNVVGLPVPLLMRLAPELLGS